MPHWEKKIPVCFFGVNFHSDKIKNFINFCILLFHKDFYILKL